MDANELLVESIKSCRTAHRASLLLAAALLLVALTAEAPQAPRDALVNLIKLKETVAGVCSEEKTFVRSGDDSFPEKSGYVISLDGTLDARLTSASLSDCSLRKLERLLDSPLLYGAYETRGGTDASYFDDDFPEDYDWDMAADIVGFSYGEAGETVWDYLRDTHQSAFDREAFRADCLSFEFNEYDTVDSIVETLSRMTREAVPSAKLLGFEVSVTAIFVVAPVFVIATMCFLLAQLAHLVAFPLDGAEIISRFPWILGSRAPSVKCLALASIWLPIAALFVLMFRLWWSESHVQRSFFVLFLLIGIVQSAVAMRLVCRLRRAGPTANAS